MAIHRDVRAALTAADELSREEHALHADVASEALAALRTKLRDLDLALGRTHRADALSLDGLHDGILKLRRFADGAAREERKRIDMLLGDVERIERQLRGNDVSALVPHGAAASLLSWRPLPWVLLGAGVALAGATAGTVGLLRGR